MKAPPSLAQAHETVDWLHALHGEATGVVAIAFGRGGHVNDNGTYAFEGRFEQRFYQWPEHAQKIGADLNAAADADIYYAPMLRSSAARKKGNALPGHCLWADLDRPPLRPDLLDQLCAAIVQSGSDGHLHVYVPVAGDLDPAEIERLNRLLVTALGADAKWSDESLLRPPGTSNRKPGGGPVWVRRRLARAKVWNPADLGALLAGATDSPSHTAAAPDVPVGDLATAAGALPADLPVHITRAMRETSGGDRSGQTRRLAGLAVEWGYDDDQVRAILERHAPTVDKHAAREGGVAAEVARLVAKLRPQHTHVGMPCDGAGCPNTPEWMRKGGSGSGGDAAWSPVDFTSWFAEPPPPVERIGSGKLLYRGAVHWIAGEPESGKSVLAYSWAVDLMRKGESVLLLDEEAARRDVFEKFKALGADGDLLRQRLHYLEPAGRNLLQDADRLLGLARTLTPGIVIVDSASAHLAIADLDEDRAPDVTKLMVRAILPLAHDLGAAVVVIDHKTKSSADSRYARGSGAKLAKTDVAFNVTAPDPFSRHKSGLVRIECTKDRLGDLGRGKFWETAVHTGDGQIQLDWRDLNDAEALAIQANSAKLRGRRESAEKVRRDAITDVLSGSIVGLTTSELVVELRKRPGLDGTVRQRLDDPLRELEAAGSIRKRVEKGNKHRWEWIR